jgi:hypothetical protein
VLEDQTNRTLLKSVTSINRLGFNAKHEPDHSATNNPQTKLLKKTQQLTALTRPNQPFRASSTLKTTSLITPTPQSDPTAIPLSTQETNSS